MNSLYAMLPQVYIPVEDSLLCPVIPIPEPIEPESTCYLNFDVVVEERQSRSPLKGLGGSRDESAHSSRSRSNS